MSLPSLLKVLSAGVALWALGCAQKGADVDFGAGDDSGSDTAGGGAGDGGGTQETPYGPENSWFHADVADIPEDLEGTGRAVGDVAYNFTLKDQFGQDVELYQFYGQVIVIDVFAEW